MILVQMFLSTIVGPLVIRNDGRVTDIISRAFVNRVSKERDLGNFRVKFLRKGLL